MGRIIESPFDFGEKKVFEKLKTGVTLSEWKEKHAGHGDTTPIATEVNGRTFILYNCPKCNATHVVEQRKASIWTAPN
jgi:hypothetical protein